MQYRALTAITSGIVSLLLATSPLLSQATVKPRAPVSITKTTPTVKVAPPPKPAPSQSSVGASSGSKTMTSSSVNIAGNTQSSLKSTWKPAAKPPTVPQQKSINKLTNSAQTPNNAKKSTLPIPYKKDGVTVPKRQIDKVITDKRYPNGTQRRTVSVGSGKTTATDKRTKQYTKKFDEQGKKIGSGNKILTSNGKVVEKKPYPKKKKKS